MSIGLTKRPKLIFIVPMPQSQENFGSVTAVLSKALTVLSVIGTALIVGWLVAHGAYGIDLTDESFYLVWISNPFIYDSSRTQFGFVYHPLYRLLNGDISSLRQANFLITFGLAWGLVYAYLHSLRVTFQESRITLHVAAAGLATGALIIFATWLPTPSYNSLALQALLITCTGLILAEADNTHSSILGWLIVGIGGWLAFMAKPSTALAVTVLGGAYLLAAGKFSVRLFLLTSVCFASLLLASAISIDGSPLAFVDRFKRGMEFGQILTDKLGHILRVDEFQLERRFKLSLLAIALMLYFSIRGILHEDERKRLLGLIISVVFFGLTALLTLGVIHWAAGFAPFHGMLIFGVTFAVLAAGAQSWLGQKIKSITRPQWSLAALFMVMPHVYAFGTDNNYWSQGGWAAIFWLMGGLILFAPLIRQKNSGVLVLPVVLATQAVTALLLQAGAEQPYRQPQPLRLNDTIHSVGPDKSELRLSADSANYLSRATTAAQVAGFQPGTPIIDLTGQSPGILFALGAKNIGQPWTLGGYPGSMRFLKAGLSRFSCREIAASWLLVEPNGPLSISPEVVLSQGAEFPGGYERAGTWSTAEGSGGFVASRVQELYRPVKTEETRLACERLRAQAAN